MTPAADFSVDKVRADCWRVHPIGLASSRWYNHCAMLGPKSVSFRDQTTGQISDLLTDEKLTCAHTQNLLAYLAGALLNFLEEGVKFTPSVVICGSINSLLQAFPGSVSYLVGTAPLDPSSGRKILKECGPLSGPNWFIYVERTNQETVEYGVFTYSRLPTAIQIPEGITINSELFCVLVRKTTQNTIELRGSKGSVLTLIFSTDRGPENFEPQISAFAKICCSGTADSKFSQQFTDYFARLIDSVLTSSHGTILICGQDLDLQKVEEMQDAVAVTPVLDLHEAFTAMQNENSAEALLRLQRCEELLQGFLRCDGVVAFDTCGRVVAYRAFYRPSASSPTTNVVGGARKRAFEGIKATVGKNISAALFRSQDGQTSFHGPTND